jgi:hypothetical protein
MVRRSSVTWTLAAMLWTSAAFGQPQDPREIQARKDCLTGKVEAGVALLADLFAETSNPNFIYNQARCYEQNGRVEDAINRFREYLRVAKNITAEEKADVDQHIAGCRAMQAEQQAAKETPAKPSEAAPAAPLTRSEALVPPAPRAETALAKTAPPSPPVVSEAEKFQPAPGGPRARLTGAVVGGVGIAALVTGGIFSYLVSSAKHEAEDNASRKIYDSSLDGRGQTYETLQWLCYGTGAALVATGVVFYVIGVRRSRAASTVSLQPSIAPSQGTVLLRGRF